MTDTAAQVILATRNASVKGLPIEGLCGPQSPTYSDVEREMLLHSDLVGIVKVKDSKIVWSNPAFAAMFGYSAEELLGQSPRIFYASDQEYREYGETALSVLQSGQTYRTETLQCHKDGTLGWYSINVRSLDGESREALALFIDITKRKEFETHLYESKLQLELALAGSDLGLWDWDISSGRVSFNERWCSMLGYRPDEVEGSIGSWERLVHPDDWPLINASLEPHFKGETPNYESEHRLRHKEGHWVWVLDRGKVVVRDNEGKPKRAAGTHLDISDRKRLKLEGTELLARIESLILGLGTRPTSAPGPDSGGSAETRSAGRLTVRQKEVLELVASGCTSAEISRRLHISTATVISHRRELARKLDLHSTAELTRYAIQHKLIPA